MSTDLVTVKEAARLVGKSEDTIKRWVRSKRLEAVREGSGPTAPVLVSKGAALAVARDAVQGASGGARAPVGRRAPGGSAGELAAVQEHLADVQRERDDLLAQRDGLRRELAEARHELASVRGELVDARKRLAVVEKELAGGVRGLLTGAVKKRLGL